MTQNKSFVVVVICLLVGIFSVVIRIPEIFDEQIYEHEWNYATVLRHIEIWNEKGALGERFVPGVTYEGKANLHINNHASLEKERLIYGDSEGNYYYVSYPPLAYMVPFWTFALLDVSPDVVAMRVFNVATQLLIASVIAFLLFRMTSSSLASILGFTLYVFNPITLLIHTTNYMSDIFVQLFFATTALFLYELTTEKRRWLSLKWTKVCFVLSLAFTIYTDWIGVFVAGTVFLFALLFRPREIWKFLLFSSVIVPIVVLVLCTIQYSSVSSLSNFLSVMYDRYFNGYVPEEMTFFEQVYEVGARYFKWFAESLFVFAALLAVTFMARLQGVTSKMSVGRKGVLAVIILLVLPALLHHLVFLNWSVHYMHFYSVFKTALLFCIVLPLAALFIWELKIEKAVIFRKMLTILLFLCLFVSGFVMYSVEMARNINPSHNFTASCDLGEKIAIESTLDDVIFITPNAKEGGFSDILPPAIMLCSHRNVQIFTTSEDARALIEQNGAKGGKLFTVDYHDKKMEYVSVQDIDVSTEI